MAMLGHAPASAQTPLDRLVIIVPGSAGGGFDNTAQALARALRSEGLAKRVEIRRSPGAGGLIALAQFDAAPAPDVPAIFIGGSSIVGAATENRSIVTLRNVTAICQLNQISLVVAVRSDSPVRSFSDLIELMRTSEDRFEWVGGSLGSPDEMLLLAIARKLDLPRERFNFIAVPGGGDAISERLLAGHHLAAVSSYEEVDESPLKSTLRMLTVSGAHRIPGVDVPTIREAGIDLTFSDWKGVFISRKASADQVLTVRDIMRRVLASPSWTRESSKHGWNAPQSSPQDFPEFIIQQERQISRLVTSDAANREPDSYYRNLLDRPWRYAVVALVAAALFAGIVVWQRLATRRSESELREARQALETVCAQIESDASSERSAIARQLDTWGLSSAEIEIAWMILKGLQFKEIAGARGTSERTVRQQAQDIYAKSGLASRAEFSAFFLEDLKF
ncbi:LuxR family transcriptional regulator [Sphingomonas sp. SUN039]|uniref:LuxR family transcriptional regulator n=1 Tax=Sphingomonas sp. SUN039 TaxID=2937787 RepID=UPI0021644AB9|nr:LuxR family transcriptional regulator [Sphingomonas sp. SUN039]UVO54577.1 LuxR family transcriptional regulator [Sphingomonas sp. SUN039]